MLHQTDDDVLPEVWVLLAHWTSDATSYVRSYAPMVTLHTCRDWGAMIQFCTGANDLTHVNSVPLFASRVVVTLSFFRSGILPEWEDPQNVEGCTYAARIPICSKTARDLWMYFTCDCVRGGMPGSLNGFLVARKSSFLKVEAWFSHAPDEDTISKLSDLFSLPLQRVPRNI
jgi:hypothetical protein